MMHQDDILLLKLIKQGDEHAFKYLFDTYFVSLCRYINLYVDSYTEAEELALDIFMNVWESREHLEIKLSLKAYLFQAARNRSLNYLRDRKETRPLDENLQDSLMSTDYPSLEMDELNHLIEEAIAALPARCKEVFIKSRQENMSNKEIATSMDISLKTVEAQITKALKLIRDFLGDGYSYLF